MVLLGKPGFPPMTSKEILKTMQELYNGPLIIAEDLMKFEVGDEVGDLFGLPFLQDLHTNSALTSDYSVLSHLVTNDLRYDSRSAFTLSLNHRETYTGITDKDRALTTRRFAELTSELFESGSSIERAQKALGAEFRTPGHIPVCSCLLYTSPSPRDRTRYRMPSSA